MIDQFVGFCLHHRIAVITIAVLLALFPAAAALVSIYGLIANPAEIAKSVQSLSGMLPASTVAQIGDEYMFGPALLVAPVTEQGATSRSVYLPAGTDWYNCAIKPAYCSGTAQPTVSGMLTVVAPAATTALQTSTKNSGSVREASSGENSTLSV